jgi:hypothetical protein
MSALDLEAELLVEGDALRTSYPDIALAVAVLMRDPRLITIERDPWEPVGYEVKPELVVDEIGVGKAVTDLLKQ